MKVYKVVETAEILKVTVQTVKAEINRGHLQAFKVGTEWRISEKALESYTKTVLNNYKTESEIRLEKENNELKKQLESFQVKFLKISQIFLGQEII